MSSLIALSITTAIFCGVWAYLSGIIGLISWAGFAGCTSFFAAGEKKEGFKVSIIANISGVFWAIVIIKVSNLLSFPIAGAIVTTIVTFAMCVQAKFKLFAHIPGTFIGSFSTFATNGNWKAILPTLIIGAILGYICETSGTWLYNLINKNNN
ncbi:hypothetical protein BD780_002500 [Clostridium tetanomorphum]|uniref:DUF1097 domain-containing protein n=1 Tax=Clostridium tetanomorphum TaxID=1553 RepID=A0A923EEF7_CLOTT|nr:DUF1097 domain-containing protein [Clostridium tetanomorphum]KAJ50053.1 glutathione-regulated potassium-efflux system protein [Clostridium tetanomorphum DSM 665]MBC2399974.1 DUF1097 domain-containing protein [Clostridium tetanomorphum]MBP1865826.1 fatty acid desaturase [Clostridium tetanomorphum]NRS85275.1 hypothetical protein [Clostridium tetanomorphum]NRZ98452.1 hypothetical protein [Clostridium tetanomorphum]